MFREEHCINQKDSIDKRQRVFKEWIPESFSSCIQFFRTLDSAWLRELTISSKSTFMLVDENGLLFGLLLHYIFKRHDACIGPEAL